MESGRLGDALVELETEGVAYGDLALTIALHGELEQTERLDGDVLRIFAAHNAKAIREGYGQLPAWFCRLPAQPRKRQVRSVFVSPGAAACLAPIYGPPTGSPRSRHLDRAALAILETQWQTPFHYDLFHGDVGHTLVLGSTGAGKSFTLNFLLVQALQYHPRVLILDLGGSYRWITRFLGGGYLELSPDDATGHGGFRLRPFALPRTERSVQFLTGWIMRLLRIGGWTVTGSDPSEIRARIEDLYAFPPARRTMTVFVHSLPAAMWPAMGRWYGNGAWGRYFDNPADGDDLELADWHVIDLAGAAEHEDLCEAALFYLLERLRLTLENPDETARVKLMVVDEAWRYLRDPAVLAYLAEAAKTWRKKNAALIMAIQSAVDVTGTAGAEALLESMPTKLFLANPELPDKAADLFRLNPSEVAVDPASTVHRSPFTYSSSSEKASLHFRQASMVIISAGYGFRSKHFDGTCSCIVSVELRSVPQCMQIPPGHRSRSSRNDSSMRFMSNRHAAFRPQDQTWDVGLQAMSLARHDGARAAAPELPHHLIEVQNAVLRSRRHLTPRCRGRHLPHARRWGTDVSLGPRCSGCLLLIKTYTSTGCVLVNHV